MSVLRAATHEPDSLPNVSKGMYPYEPDEFDAPADPDGPRGVHRAPRSNRSRWMPFVIVLLVVPGLAYGTVWTMTHGGLSSLSTLPFVGTLFDSQETESGTVSAVDVDEAAAAEEEEAVAEPEETAAPAPEADMSVAVMILNAAGINGLAAEAQTALTGAGFTSVSVGNISKGSLTQSVVYYTTAEEQVTAEKVAATLGLTAVEQSTTQTAPGITVVLLTDLP